MVKTRSAHKKADTLALDKNQQKKVAKETKKIKRSIEDGSITIKNTHKENKLQAAQKRGLIYVGHIPHGFYEEAMRDYFKQFGKVTNVKLCRSNATGNSKGFGYVEFAHPEVAKIAADTMNNYIMFKKRIVTEYVPYEKRPRRLFQGKSSTKQNTSVKTRSGKQKFSRNKILDDKTVSKKRKKTLNILESKLKKLQELGIQCNIKPVGGESKKSQEVKVEAPIISISTDEVDGSDSDSVEFKRPSLKLIKSKNALPSPSKNTLGKSLSVIRPDRTVLTKSLDSVHTLLSNNRFIKSQDEVTQTLPLKKFKVEVEKRKSKGLVKIKKEKVPVKLNSETVKQIARELIRKRGNPLINVVTSKSKYLSKKK